MAIDKSAVSGLGYRFGRRYLLRTLSMSPLMLVAACGAGGADVASTPPPSSYQKLAELTASTTLATQAATYHSSRPNSAPIPTLQSQASSIEISYDPTNQTYTVRGAPVIGSTTTITQNFGPSNAVSGIPGSYENITTTVSRTDVRRLTIGTTPLTYTNVGSWAVGVTTGTDQTFDTAYFTYGIPTKTSDMPKTGSASYALAVVGTGSRSLNGTGSLAASFAAGTVDVSLRVQATLVERAGSFTNVATIDVATVTGSGTISAAVNNPGFSSSLSGGGYSGSINGLFYGPQAAEVGGAFAITNGGEAIAGVVIGQKD